MFDRTPTQFVTLPGGRVALRYGIYNASGILQRYEYMALEDEPTEQGTPYNVASVLPADVKAALGLPGTAIPRDAFMALASSIGGVPNAIIEPLATTTATLLDVAIADITSNNDLVGKFYVIRKRVASGTATTLQIRVNNFAIINCGRTLRQDAAQSISNTFLDYSFDANSALVIGFISATQAVVLNANDYQVSTNAQHGIARMATDAEITAGTVTNRFVNPAQLASRVNAIPFVSSNIQIFTATGTFAAPLAGRYRVRVQGAGGRTAVISGVQNQISIAAAGGYAEGVVTLAQGQQVAVTVATGATVQATSFGTFMTANMPATQAFSMMTTRTGTATGGAINVTGGAGISALYAPGEGFAIGGASMLGTGAVRITIPITVNTQDGMGYGGGSSTNAGFNGGPGIVIVEWLGA
jgi:hypothetical protein